MFSQILSLLASNHCDNSFLGIPSWHKHLDKTSTCDVEIDNLNDIWSVALGILEILLRFSAYIAILFILWGAFDMMMSQGNPDRVSKARGTITNAVIGLVIAIMATAIVSFVAGIFD